MIKNLHINRSLTRLLATMAFAIFMLTPGWGWGQTTIAIQDFETVPATPTWSYTANGGSINSTFNRYNGAQSYRLASNNVLTMSNFNITGYTSVVLSVAFASLGVDSNEDLFMDISYDAGNTWTGAGSIKLVDGLSNASIVINTTTPNTVSSNPWPTNISVTETQIRVRFRATAMDAGEYYFIDDVKLTGILAITPTKLAITSISPSQPTIGSGFNVTVQAQDESNNPGNVTANTTFNLSSNGNAGTIGGTISGQINAGSNAVTVVGVTLSASGTGVTLTATRTGGDNLSAGTSNPFSVLEPATHLAFSGVPTTGVINTNLSSFTVEARRPDNSIDNTFTGNVTLSKATGTGAISGTLIKACIAGQATFNDIKFDVADTYTISSTSSSLTGSTSSNIAISLAIPSPPNSISFGSVTNNSFNTTFVAPVASPTGYLVLRRSVLAVTGTPVGGIEYTSGQTDIGGGINEVMYVGSNVWTNNPQNGLTDNTAYHYAIYSYNGSGTFTVYSATALIGNQTTSAIPAPTATTADPIGSNGFTANWGAVAGASSYKIDIYTETAGANATDLFISEYVEGSSNNKYIEIYNGTGSPIDLSNYNLRLFNNGASAPSEDLQLSGTLNNNSTIVYKNALATVYTGASNISGACSFNGDDALAIYKPSTLSYIDIFGRIGNDPGTAWTSASNTTVDKTLVRKSSVQGGVTTNPTGTGSSAFTTLETEWTQHAIDNVSNLGSHTFIGGTTQTFEVENITVNGTSYDATGLDPNSTYYYRVRAVGANSTSTNSNVITVATSAAAPTSTIFSNTGTGTNNWNDGPWSNGLPGTTSEAVIDGTATITTPVEVTNLTINASRKLIIASTGSLTVTGILANNAGNSGLVIESGGSLISSSVSVAATVEREIISGKWHLISPPVQNMYAGSFSNVFLQSWSEPDAEWTYITDENTPLLAAKGYSLFNDLATTTYQFEGALHSGDKSVGITHDGASGSNIGSNLVGNPYPSYIDWNTIIGYGACYVWNGSVYLAYPETGSYGTGSRYIAPVQGFFIVVNNDGEFSLTNENRVHNIAPFYKSVSEIPSNSLMLEATGNDYSDKLIIRYNEETTQDFEMRSDAYKFVSSTEGISQLYSYTGDKKLSIDVRPSCEVIQLGFTNTLSGEYQIGISEMNGISKATLEDTKTATFHNLLNGPYSFSYTAGDDDKRFKIRMGTVGIDNPTAESFNIYSYDKTAVIDLPAQAIGDIYIYNLAGQLIKSEESATGKVSISLNSTGVYMVKVVTKMETITQKVWIK